MKVSGSFLLALVMALALTVSGLANASSAGTEVDLERGVDFEGFMARAAGQNIDKFLNRLGSITLSGALRREAEGVDEPLIIVVYGYTWCRDMAIVAPFIESVRRANPESIAVKFYIRGDEDADFLIKQTGIDRTPAIFLAATDGRLLEGHFYSKFPAKVQKLIDDSPDKERADAHIDDHRAGKYDDEVQADLAQFLAAAVPELKKMK